MRAAVWGAMLMSGACVAWAAGGPGLESPSRPDASGPRIANSLNTRDLLTALVGPEVVFDALVYVPVPPSIAEMVPAARAFTTVQYVATFRQGDAERAWVVLSTNADEHDCHACAPRVGFAALTHVRSPEGATGWRVDTLEADWGARGAYGTLPSFELEQVGAERYALRAEFADMHQGYMWGGAFWVVEGAGRFIEGAHIDTFVNNEGLCGPQSEPCFEHETSSRFEPGASPDVWDLVLKRKGTRQTSDGGVGPVPPLERWTWSPATQTWVPPSSSAGR
jgi:hypothetical protein